MADLEQALVGALHGRHERVLTAPEPADAERLAAATDLPARLQTAALAVELGRSSDKRGARYVAARRRVERYRVFARGDKGKQRRRPSPADITAVAGAARAVRAAPLRPGHTATITGMVRISDDLRRRTVSAPISKENGRAYLSAYAAGNYRRAAAAFLDGFRASYSGVPLVFESVEAVKLESDRAGYSWP